MASLKVAGNTPGQMVPLTWANLKTANATVRVNGEAALQPSAVISTKVIM